jgi:hypothetical protein
MGGRAAPCITRPGTMRARAPILSESLPATGAMRRGGAVHGRDRRPVPNDELPSANWRYWLVRKIPENIAAAGTVPVTVFPARSC